MVDIRGLEIGDVFVVVATYRAAYSKAYYIEEKYAKTILSARHVTTDALSRMSLHLAEYVSPIETLVFGPPGRAKRKALRDTVLYATVTAAARALPGGVKIFDAGGEKFVVDGVLLVDEAGINAYTRLGLFSYSGGRFVRYIPPLSDIVDDASRFAGDVELKKPMRPEDAIIYVANAVYTDKVVVDGYKIAVFDAPEPLTKILFMLRDGREADSEAWNIPVRVERLGVGRYRVYIPVTTLYADVKQDRIKFRLQFAPPRPATA